MGHTHFYLHKTVPGSLYVLQRCVTLESQNPNFYLKQLIKYLTLVSCTCLRVKIVQVSSIQSIFSAGITGTSSDPPVSERSKSDGTASTEPLSAEGSTNYLKSHQDHEVRATFFPDMTYHIFLFSFAMKHTVLRDIVDSL